MPISSLVKARLAGSGSSLTSKINDHFAMRLSHLVTRDSEVPDGTHNTDQETSVSLVYTF
jgi:putative salt-induced outer membrane protein YdiY